MTIKYALYPTNFGSKKPTYYARVITSQLLDTEDIIEIVAKRGTTVTHTDVRSVIDILSRVIEDKLAEGASIHLPFANFSLTIKGQFNEFSDKFNHRLHTITPTVNKGKLLKKATFKHLPAQKIRIPKKHPHLITFKDLASGTNNDMITPGGLGILLGYNLAIDLLDPTQGIYLVKKDKKKIQYPVPDIGKNEDSELIFKIPDDLEKGIYTCKVCTMLRDGTPGSGKLVYTLAHPSVHRRRKSTTIRRPRNSGND